MKYYNACGGCLYPPNGLETSGHVARTYFPALYLLRGHGCILLEALDRDVLVPDAGPVNFSKAPLPDLARPIKPVRQLLQLLESEQQRGDHAA